MAKSKKQGLLYSSVGFRFLVLTTIAALVVLVGKNFTEHLQYSNVLGSSSFIADKGSDSGESNTPSNTQQTAIAAPTAKPTEVEHRVEPTEIPEVKTPEPTEVPEVNMESLGKVQFESENGRTKLHLEQGGSKLEISNEDGKLSIKAKNANGTELQLQEEDALDKINEALKGEDVEVGTGSGNLLTIRKGQVQAETHFPLSINPATNTLTVTTPAGVKDVAVLPNVAVQNLLQQRIIDEVKTTTTATNGAQLQLITLGLLNNQPAFQVIGFDNKKLLGLLPVSIDKTTFVSAQTGQVIKVDETFFQRLLDLFSVQ